MNDDAYWYGKSSWQHISANRFRLVNLPPVEGDGGPGSIYSSTAFETAVAKHGRPFGPFEMGRQGLYGRSGK